VLVGRVEQTEAHGQRGVHDVAVGVGGRDLVLRERRAAARAPGHRAVAAVEPPAAVALLQEAPDVGDVRVGHREVRPLPVHPLAEPLGLPGLHARVLGDAIAAGAHEALQAVRLDVAFRVQAERLLDLDLDPQALAVEPVLVAQLLAEAGVVALEQVLQRAAPRVVGAHRVVRGDRPVEERERRPAGAQLAQLLERALALPAIEDPVLELGVVRLGRHGAKGETGHPPPDGSLGRAKAPAIAARRATDSACDED
jgi:hypothetical protein